MPMMLLLPALMPPNKMLLLVAMPLLLALAESQAQSHDYPSTECVHEYFSSTAMNGSFQSPGFPVTYPANTVCRYIFQGKGRERVQIMFTALDLDYPTGDPKAPYDCEDVDSVTVSVNIDNQHRDLGVYCGNKRPPMLMSNDNRMEVVFQSTSPGNVGPTGFKAEYKFVTNFGIKAGEQGTDMVCSFTFKSDVETNGTFKSPNFPGLYPRNTECHYLFYGKTNERIHITFPYFDVEGIPPSCTEDTQSDFVEFSNFNIKLKDRKMTRFCGTREDDKNKKEVKSDGNFFRVTFKSMMFMTQRGSRPSINSANTKTLSYHPTNEWSTILATVITCLLLAFP